MTDSGPRAIVVTGATGLQGGAVARQLLEDGWHVRGLTRDADSKRSQVLAALGAEVVQGNMADATSLRPFFEGAYGVYSVQNPFIGGPEAEVRQSKNVADVAKDAGVEHLVYGSAGTGRAGTGVPSWETKLQVENHTKALGLPLTILRPTAFMKLLTHKKFFPPVAASQIMPKLMGSKIRCSRTWPPSSSKRGEAPAWRTVHLPYRLWAPPGSPREGHSTGKHRRHRDQQQDALYRCDPFFDGAEEERVSPRTPENRG